VACNQATFVVELTLAPSEVVRVQKKIQLLDAKHAAVEGATLSDAQIEKHVQRELKSILSSTVASSERTANEGEAAALLRRMAYWAVLFPNVHIQL
jgi:hypothetical protein